jgi:FAD/FMN-containing dehydrogenase
LVRYLVDASIPFSVRSGGHDLNSSSIIHGAVTIDMRAIDFASIADDKKTARIGGGITHGKLLDKLADHGLMTTVGSAGTVGFVGWSTLGGYGAYTPRCGLGVDQIVGAKIVDAQGQERTADERLLKVIRGGGGNFGVIVELTVKIYPAEPVRISLPDACSSSQKPS